MNAINIVPRGQAGHVTNRQLLRGLGVNVPDDIADAISIDEVCELIDATGPLTIRDIAGGLAVSLRSAVALVRRMVRIGALKRDEFGRYRLWGSSTMR